MKKSSMLFCAFTVLMFSGCWKPYHEALMVDIGTSEVAFLVETINDNGQAVITPKGKDNDGSMDNFYADRYVNARKVQIPYYWKQTSRYFFWEDGSTGEWRPAARLIVVNTEVETREWTPSVGNKNQGIWVESSDSVGFSTGITITANIANKEDAIVFLSNYPPKSNRQVETKGGAAFTVEVTSLAQIMDSEVRSKVQEIYNHISNGYNMDDLRDKKQYIMNVVKNGGTIQVVNPDTGEKEPQELDGVIPYFKEKGITITTLGQFGGFTYESKEIQTSIDNVFQAQQDEEVARAETKAAEARKEALRLKGEGEAAQILESRRGEAEGITLVAEARAKELSLLQENPEVYMKLQTLEVMREAVDKWDGSLPKALFGGEVIVDGKKLIEE